MIKLHRIFIILSWISFSFLTACTTPGKNTLPQNEGMTMAQIYQQQTNTNLVDTAGDFNPTPYIAQHYRLNTLSQDEVRGSVADIDKHFKQLPNPEITMYVYPHLAHEDGDAEPVPGYTTAFFLYKENHFAMNSEVY